MTRCSSLPALDECPCFVPGPSEYTGPGTERHAAFSAALQGNDFLLSALEEDDYAGVEWAVNYVRRTARSGSYPMALEERLIVRDCHPETGGEISISGTPDVVCHRDVWDLKWRSDANYKPQMAGYALLVSSTMSDSTIRVHVLHAAFKRLEILTFTIEEARAVVLPILEKANAPDKQPAPCSFCSWCAAKATCPALGEMANAVVVGREDWKLATYHASAIDTPDEMAKALRIASMMTKWAEAVKWHAKEMLIKRGLSIPGFELKTKSGKSSCADVLGAFRASGLEASAFLACCDIRMGEDPDHPEKAGLIATYAAANEISKAEAKRRLKTKLEDTMRTPKEIQYLRAVKGPDTEETEAIDA